MVREFFHKIFNLIKIYIYKTLGTTFPKEKQKIYNYHVSFVELNVTLRALFSIQKYKHIPTHTHSHVEHISNKKHSQLQTLYYILFLIKRWVNVF